jgi:hypothetical protein
VMENLLSMLEALVLVPSITQQIVKKKEKKRKKGEKFPRWSQHRVQGCTHSSRHSSSFVNWLQWKNIVASTPWLDIKRRWGFFDSNSEHLNCEDHWSHNQWSRPCPWDRY